MSVGTRNFGGGRSWGCEEGGEGGESGVGQDGEVDDRVG